MRSLYSLLKYRKNRRNKDEIVGAGKSSFYSRALDSVSAMETYGDFHTCASKMEAVWEINRSIDISINQASIQSISQSIY